MTEFPFGYEQIAPTTWAYISSLLMLAMFFKFNRFWSIRNVDLVFLILLAPGLILVRQNALEMDRHRIQRQPVAARADRLNETAVDDSSADSGAPVEDSAANATGQPDPPTPIEYRLRRLQRLGFIWLFAVGLIYLLRLLLDPRLKRKPLLEPNINRSGLTFLACSLAIFLFADIVQTYPVGDELKGPLEAMRILDRQSDDEDHFARYGPGLGFLHVLPVIPTFLGQESARGALDENSIAIVIAKIMALLLQVAIVAGLIVMGRRQFGNYHTGIAMAVIYLMLPSTLHYAGNSWHMLPAALTLWAVISFRVPVVSGILIGLAAGVSYYPIFLLPLWFSFYWERGATRFAAGVVSALVAVVISLVFTVDTVGQFVQQLRSMFGVLLPRVEGLRGSIWELGWEPWFRLPILVGFMILSVSFVFWPARKNLGTLIAYSAALMVAVQFWLGFEGGLFIAWYLPLALLTFFRPNLDQVTATS